MAESGAKREAKCKAKKKRAGLVQYQLWIRPEWKEILRKFIESLKSRV